MDLEEYLKKNADEVNRLLDNYYGSPKSQLSEAANHLLFAGGKRLRPIMFKLVAEAVKKGSSAEIMPAALALEVTHCFTLIHDDIMDDDRFRRGKPTVHTVWDEPTAILAGDVLYARAFELVCHAKAPELSKIHAVQILSQACVEICEGQQMDMSFEERDDVSRAEYMSMVARKTGILYGAAAGMGALLAGATDPQVTNLSTFGSNIGAAFQIQDDIIDLVASSEKSGKDRASDIREGKQTILAIKARQRGIDLSRYQHDLTDEEINEVIQVLTDEGVIDDVRSEADDLVRAGVRALNVLEDSQEKELLKELAYYFIERGY